MDINRPIRSLEDIFNDPDSEIILKDEKHHKDFTNQDFEIERFKDLQKWINNHNGKEPQKTDDLSERELASWLLGLRKDPKRMEFLKKYDNLGLLKNNAKAELIRKLKSEKREFNSLEEVLNDNSILFDNIDESLDIKLFDTREINEIKKKQDNLPKNKSRRRKVKNFEKYKVLFKEVQQDIASGKRRIIPYDTNTISRHKFYVLNGQLLYIESVGEEFVNHTRSSSQTDARLHVIYDNGTENYPLRNGLIASLYGSFKRHIYGKAVSDPEELSIDPSKDHITGYVYVLKTLSKNPDIKKIQEKHPLYKVGFTSRTVKQRIANAEHETTYLCAPVKVVAEYKVINLNPEALETALHHALAPYRLSVSIKTGEDKFIHPREWFVTDLDTINDLVNGIISKLRMT